VQNIADFIILGAQKAGTTSLYAYLANHPQILMASEKEVHFFDLHFDNGLDWYRSRFPYTEIRKGYLIGEATPYYLFHPRAPERLAQIIPHAKLIVLLRDPVERAISHYHHEVRFGWETLSFDEAITKEPERLEDEVEKLRLKESYYSFNHQHYSYLARGLYMAQLKLWYQFFPRAQIAIFRAEDLYANPASTLTQVLTFLGLPDYQLKEYRKHNEGIRQAEVTQDSINSLVEYFQSPNQELEQYLGMQFGWKF